MPIHRSAGTTPFYLVLSLPPLELTLDHTALRNRVALTSELRKYYFQRLRYSISKKHMSLDRAQSRYKPNLINIFGHQSKLPTRKQFFDVYNQETGKDKFDNHDSVPFRVFSVGKLTTTIEREEYI